MAKVFLKKEKVFPDTCTGCYFFGWKYGPDCKLPDKYKDIYMKICINKILVRIHPTPEEAARLEAKHAKNI